MGELLRVGVVGCGAIGSALCAALTDGTVAAELVGVCDVDDAAVARLQAALDPSPPRRSLVELAAAAEIVVEAVSPTLAPTVVSTALEHGADVLVMSVGGLVDRDDLVTRATLAGRRIHVPTGAIAGLDAVRAAAVAGLDRVVLTTTKPPRGLAGAPYLVERGIDPASFTTPTVVFSGTAREAVAGFPKNVNVAAALSLAGIGFDRTEVRVVVDPTSDVNQHRIEVEGRAGRLAITVDNVPSPQNPKTSFLAALSAIALLQRLTTAQVIGS